MEEDHSSTQRSKPCGGSAKIRRKPTKSLHEGMLYSQSTPKPLVAENFPFILFAAHSPIGKTETHKQHQTKKIHGFLTQPTSAHAARSRRSADLRGERAPLGGAQRRSAAATGARGLGLRGKGVPLRLSRLRLGAKGGENGCSTNQKIRKPIQKFWLCWCVWILDDIGVTGYFGGLVVQRCGLSSVCWSKCWG